MAITLEQFRQATEGLDPSTELWAESANDGGEVRACWKLPVPQTPDDYFVIVLSDQRETPKIFNEEVREDQGLVLLVEDPPSDDAIGRHAQQLGAQVASLEAWHGADSGKTAGLIERLERLRERNEPVATRGFWNGYRHHFLGYTKAVRSLTPTDLEAEIPY